MCELLEQFPKLMPGRASEVPVYVRKASRTTAGRTVPALCIGVIDYSRGSTPVKKTVWHAIR